MTIISSLRFLYIFGGSGSLCDGGGRLSQKIFYLIPRVQYLNCYSSLLPFWQRLSKQLCAVRFFPSSKTKNFNETVEKLLNV